MEEISRLEEKEGSEEREDLKEKERPERKSRQEEQKGLGEENERARQEGSKEQGLYKSKFRLTGCLGAKILAFILLLAGIGAGILSGLVLISAWEGNMYTTGEKVAVTELLSSRIHDAVEYARYCVEIGRMDVIEADLAGGNLDLALLDLEGGNKGEEKVIWGTYSGYSAAYTRDVLVRFPGGEESEDIFLNGTKLDRDKWYTFRAYVNPDLPAEDEVKLLVQSGRLVYELRYACIGGLLGSFFLCLLCLIFLLCGAGHRNDREGIVPSVVNCIHLDLLTGIYVLAMVFLLYIVMALWEQSGADYFVIMMALITFAAMALTGISVLYLTELAIRMKLGGWWRHTLIYVVLRGCWRIVRFLFRGMFMLIREIPLVHTVVLAYLGLCILEFMGCMFFLEAEGMVLWAMEKVVLLVVLLYVSMLCRRLLEGSRAMAQGQEDYTVNTRGMFGAFREHGENLNSLSQGISKAVAERMKSEHLKTELITNVSHDLKTPLTSIINYADLICQEQTENPRIGEYAEVLLRQSRRLKKLLEDLVEASKATTGNLEVNLEPCEAGVILSQAVGEYQQRMEEKDLKLIVNQPEEPVQILADGRHLWRVFDNLLNNVCKYAQENSRVYLSVEQKEGQVLIIFRNMSKYVLNIPAQELEERFVRGDKSRHMDGNGLGLSIAGSLMELQQGKMEIVIDGDLFKVILRFGQL